MKFDLWYNNNHKRLLVIPAIVLTLSLIYLVVFYVQTGDIINKDVSLTGGSIFTIYSGVPSLEVISYLSNNFSDFSVNSISDNAGNQIELIVTVPEYQTENVKSSLEDFFGYELTSENSSIETTSASLSEDFYRQLIVAVLLAFFWMSAVVFLIFSKGKKVKMLVIILNLFFGFFMGNLFFRLNLIFSLTIFMLFFVFLVYLYIKNSVPAFAVMLSAFADITMTLSVVNLTGMKLSIAGLVAFLMLIGYSVDTDILLTTRLLKRREGVNAALFRAFKTGVTMTLTSLVAVIAALIVVYSFNSVLNQIFIILLIGLCFDILNTWITNAGIIKWYVEAKG
jgi:preprotein translocase subunit SecF